MTRPKIYVAGPYTQGDPVAHTHRAIQLGQRLWEAGFAPYVPHLNLLWHVVAPAPPGQWYALDLEWLDACAALIRLPGESPGAEGEALRALTNDVVRAFLVPDDAPSAAVAAERVRRGADDPRWSALTIVGREAEVIPVLTSRLAGDR